jgi:hypothetical protein
MPIRPRAALGDSIFPTAASTQRSRRGTIQVLDRPGLEKASCECYAIVNERFDAFLTPPSTAVPGHNKKPRRSSRKRLSVPPPSGSERRGPVIFQMSVSTFASDTVRPQRDVRSYSSPQLGSVRRSRRNNLCATTCRPSPSWNKGSRQCYLRSQTEMRAKLAALRPNFQPSYRLLAISVKTGTGSSKWRGIVWQGNALKTAGSNW